MAQVILGEKDMTERERTGFEGARNFRVIRFQNEKVLSDVSGIVNEILGYHPCHFHGARYLIA